MNEWVKRIRCSVQSVVDGKRRKSTASSPAPAERKNNITTDRPHTVAPELELPPALPPQLPGLTKQRARGPPRRRPSPRPGHPTAGGDQRQQQRTVSCPPADTDPARFAWGRDPSIDPALFFSDVVGRCMGDGRGSRDSAWAGDRRLGSIAESDDGAGSEGSREEGADGSGGAAERSKNGSASDIGRSSVSSNRLSEDAQRASMASEESVRNSKSESGEGQTGEGKTPSEDGKETPPQTNLPTEADSERPASTVTEGRKSPVLHLTGGEVEGAPRRRFCSIL